jgi:RNA-binding protein
MPGTESRPKPGIGKSTPGEQSLLKANLKRRLRARAHGLKPVVMIGAAGITPTVIAAADLALDDHALVKIRVSAQDRGQRRTFIDEICHSCRADLVQTVGHIAVLFREPEDR